MLSDPVAEAFGLIHCHPSGENFFREQIWRHFQVAPVWGRRVLDVQLKQSNFMTSKENVNKLCLFVQETEDLQVKLTMMVCPERISNVYNFTDVVSFWFSIQEAWASMKNGCWYPVVVLNLAKSIHASAICFNFYWKLRFIWGLRITYKTVFQLNQLGRFNTDIRLEDRQSQLGSNERWGGNRSMVAHKSHNNFFKSYIFYFFILIFSAIFDSFIKFWKWFF